MRYSIEEIQKLVKEGNNTSLTYAYIDAGRRRIEYVLNLAPEKQLSIKELKEEFEKNIPYRKIEDIDISKIQWCFKSPNELTDELNKKYQTSLDESIKELLNELGVY